MNKISALSAARQIVTKTPITVLTAPETTVTSDSAVAAAEDINAISFILAFLLIAATAEKTKVVKVNIAVINGAKLA